jgi:ankyrin repeat protein
LIKALLAQGADANAMITRAPQRVGFTRGGLNLVGATPFLVAAASGDAEVMRLVRAAGADPALATKDGTTPLMAAAGVGRVSAESLIEENSAIDAVKEAIAAGGDVNGANSGGDTALHGAASMRWNAMVRFLIERGALIDVQNKRGRTPLANAAGSSTADLLRPPAGPPDPDVPVR